MRTQLSFSISRLLLTCIALPITCSALWAQATTSLRGTVTDPTEALVQGANITLENTGTAAARTAVTDSIGAYQVLQLPPGTYRIRVEKAGFKSVVHANLQLLVNTPATLNLQLKELGQISETIDVSGTAVPAINTVDATLGNTIQNTQIVALL